MRRIGRALRHLRRLSRCQAGNFALILALSAPLLLGLAGGGVDLVVYRDHQSQLQATADSAALAAVREASMKGWSADSAKQIAASLIQSNLRDRFSGTTYAYSVAVDEARRQATVTLSQDHYGYFFLGYFAGSPQIKVRSVARESGQATICIIAESTTGKGALQLDGNASVEAAGCSAYSNSSDSKGLSVMGKSYFETKLICTVGGYQGNASNYSSLPITDCPSIDDPLSARAAVIDHAVASEGCDYEKVQITNQNTTLSPGVYCDGLAITSRSNVTFSPGLYVIRDGDFKVDKQSSLSGRKVGFIFTGDNAKMDLMNDSTVSFTAPETGLMAGILFYVQPATAKSRDFRIGSKNAEQLLGTVYLPADRLIVGGAKDDDVCDTDTSTSTGGAGWSSGSGSGSTGSGSSTSNSTAGSSCISDVGNASAWTAIVAAKLQVTTGATLIVNSDYGATKVPAPEGIGPNSSLTSLVE